MTTQQWQTMLNRYNDYRILSDSTKELIDGDNRYYRGKAEAIETAINIIEGYDNLTITRYQITKDGDIITVIKVYTNYIMDDKDLLLKYYPSIGYVDYVYPQI